MAELRTHVREDLAEPRRRRGHRPQRLPQEGDRVLRRRPPVVRPARQGRQLPGRRLPGLRRRAGYAPLDRRLYLPEDWAEDEARREKCHVPPTVKFQEKWQIALDLLDRSLPGLPHGWIAGDDEFGRAAEFRAALRQRGERYVLDVPCNTTVRDLERRRPRRRQAGAAASARCRSRGRTPGRQSQPESRWERITVRDGEKGPLEVDAMTVRVRAKQDGRIGPEERLVVMRPVGESASRLCPDQRGRRVSPWPSWSERSGSGTGSRRCSRQATAKPVWIITRSAVGWAGITT